MILSRRWLNEFTDVSGVSDKAFSDAMTISGSKVEVTTRPGDSVSGVIVCRITRMEKHPDSDHMWVCMVDAGEGRTIQVVTGAQNQRVGDLVPLALDGAVLPGGKKIEKSVLRGVVSDGMLCSYQELGFTDNDWPFSAAHGLFILNTDPDIAASDPRPGDDIRPLLGLDDSLVEFEITPNRPDCLSVIGLAREAAATFDTGLHLHAPVVKGSGGDIRDLVSVEIDDSSLCRRYTARMVKNVKIGPSPKWMRERLRAGGVRPISNIVDITNYVMLEYGQPMHAFDFSCVEGGKIIVRTAREGETITTLDDKPRELGTSMLCICDELRPVCVAGVMGGANSEIIGDTAQVLFEAANFNGTSVRRTASALGMRTDSSGRFEKGLDVMNTMDAVNRACELVEMLGCGEVVDGVIDVFPGGWEPAKVRLEPGRINGLLGTGIGEDEMRRILLKLGFSIDGDMITVPSWRGDVERCPDIAEEVARFYGYNNIPSTLQKGSSIRSGYTPEQTCERDLGSACRSCGFSEIITFSFVSPSNLDKIRVPADSPLRDTFKIMSPLGEDTSVMRTSALPSMLEVLSRNRALRNENVRLYELARLYFKTSGKLADEPKVLSMGAYGEDMDFYTMKGAVETVLSALRITGAEFTACDGNPSYHPGRCAEISVGGKVIGVFGQIHPEVQKTYSIDCSVFAAEISFSGLFENRGAEPVYHPLPKYPAVTRDIAVVCSQDVTAASLEKAIRRSGGEILRSVKLFDVYTGKGIPSGKRSIAFSLTMRSDEGTLTDEQAEECVSGILSALESELGAVLR